MIKQYLKTKKGATSLFVVIFTIILLGVITLGFSRLMLSDASRTSDNDLSQSAYDAAMAGVEDAKIALIKYHKCFKAGGDNSTECSNIKSAMSSGMEQESCDVVPNALNRKNDLNNGETPIRQNTKGDQNSDYIDQAYTCVTIKEKLSDYRSTINDSNRTRLVPLKTSGANGESIVDVKKVTIKWYSSANFNSATNTDEMNDKFKNQSEQINQPPTIGLQFVQTDSEFNLSQLSAASGDSQTDRSTIYLKPSSELKYKDTDVTTAEMSKSADKAKKPDGANQDPHLVYCDLKSNAGFACTATINIPNTFKNGSASGTPFFIVSLPYGQPETDFSIQMRKHDNTVVSFDGAQARIDSTGRANELYRRVESRVDLTDAFFPYPEYAIQMSGDGNDGEIEKNFYVTNDCWSSGGDGTAKGCNTSGEVK